MSHLTKDPNNRFCLACGKDLNAYSQTPGCEPVWTEIEISLLLKALTPAMVFRQAASRAAALAKGVVYDRSEEDNPMVRAFIRGGGA